MTVDELRKKHEEDIARTRRIHSAERRIIKILAKMSVGEVEAVVGRIRGDAAASTVPNATTG